MAKFGNQMEQATETGDAKKFDALFQKIYQLEILEFFLSGCESAERENQLHQHEACPLRTGGFLRSWAFILTHGRRFITKVT